MKILVVGDYIEDYYVFGTSSRLCPEAPVPVVIPQSTRNSRGGSGLVHDQLKELGGETEHWGGSWSHKERIFIGSHLVCRIDKDSVGDVRPWEDGWLTWADAIVISDYGKGALTPALAEIIIDTDKPVFVDAKHHWNWYARKNVTAFPNYHEIVDKALAWGKIVRKLGAQGCQMGFVGDADFIQLPATVAEVVDVTGAGDIFMAGFVYAWSIQLPAEDCLRFANALAGESCRHVGTYVVPRSFAQAELDRLQVSKESPQPLPDCSPGSNWSANPRWQQDDLVAEESGAYKSGIPPADFLPVGEGYIETVYSPPREQTLPESPSVPTVPSGAPLPSDQESSDEQDRRLR